MNEGYIDQEENVEQKIHGRMAHKKQLITDSLFGTLNDHQLFLIKQSWMHIVNLEELILDIEKRIDVILSNYQRKYSFWLQCRELRKTRQLLSLRK